MISNHCNKYCCRCHVFASPACLQYGSSSGIIDLIPFTLIDSPAWMWTKPPPRALYSRYVHNYGVMIIFDYGKCYSEGDKYSQNPG